MRHRVARRARGPWRPRPQRPCPSRSRAWACRPRRPRDGPGHACPGLRLRTPRPGAVPATLGPATSASSRRRRRTARDKPGRGLGPRQCLRDFVQFIRVSKQASQRQAEFRPSCPRGAARCSRCRTGCAPATPAARRRHAPSPANAPRRGRAAPSAPPTPPARASPTARWSVSAHRAAAAARAETSRR
jgi:hypothetical protein